MNRHRYVEMGDALIWNMPNFRLEDDKVDDLVNKASKHKVLILIYVAMVEAQKRRYSICSAVSFDRDVKIADIKRRKETKPVVAKTRGGDAFKGQLVVLIDSRSGSAAELLARVVQLENAEP